MKDLRQGLEKHIRRVPLHGLMGDNKCGAFSLYLDGSVLEFFVIASSNDGWDHVSVSTQERIPRWNEMQQIKELFFEDSECVMQLHPPKDDYININPYCLHLWRPWDQKIPMPPKFMV